MEEICTEHWEFACKIQQFLEQNRKCLVQNPNIYVKKSKHFNRKSRYLPKNAPSTQALPWNFGAPFESSYDLICSSQSIMACRVSQ